MREHELAHAFLLNHPARTERAIPFMGNVADWLRRLEVYTPLDEERIRDLERWRAANPVEHAEAFVSLLSVVDAMRGCVQAKVPLSVCFPKRARPPQRTPHQAL